MAASGVLDLSFLNIKSENDINNGIIEKTKQDESPKKTKSGTLNSPPSSPSKNKSTEYKAIRLGNNEIININIIKCMSSHEIIFSNILWLDLSFNLITKITDEFIELLPNILTLYLHANKISKLSEIKKLGQFQALKSLTVYGNPVEENKHYRNMVIYTCKNLQQLDFTPITGSQRKKVNILLILSIFIYIYFFILIITSY